MNSQIGRDQLVRASHFTDSLIENLHEIHDGSAKSITQNYRIKTRKYERLEKDLRNRSKKNTNNLKQLELMQVKLIDFEQNRKTEKS